MMSTTDKVVEDAPKSDKRYNPGRSKRGSWGDLKSTPSRDIEDLAEPTALDKKYAGGYYDH